MRRLQELWKQGSQETFVTAAEDRSESSFASADTSKPMDAYSVWRLGQTQVH